MLKVALLSGWHVHTGGYAKFIQEQPDAKLTVIWDDDEARGKEWAERLGIDYESDLSKMLAREDVDAVLCDAPTNDHCALLVQCAKAGLLILTAKELGVQKTIAEVENLQFISTAERLNIGNIINKKLLAASRIFQLLLDEDSSNAKCLALSDAEVMELVAKENSKITKAPVKELKLPSDLTIGGLVRNGHGMIVTGNTWIHPNDHVVIFCLDTALHKIDKLFN